MNLLKLTLFATLLITVACKSPFVSKTPATLLEPGKPRVTETQADAIRSAQRDVIAAETNKNSVQIDMAEANRRAENAKGTLSALVAQTLKDVGCVQCSLTNDLVVMPPQATAPQTAPAAEAPKPEVKK